MTANAQRLAQALTENRYLASAFSFMLQDAAEDEFPDLVVQRWTEDAGFPSSAAELSDAMRDRRHGLSFWAGDYFVAGADGALMGELSVRSDGTVSFLNAPATVVAFENDVLVCRTSNTELRASFALEGFDEATHEWQPLVHKRALLVTGGPEKAEYVARTVAVFFGAAPQLDSAGPAKPTLRRASTTGDRGSLSSWKGTYRTLYGKSAPTAQRDLIIGDKGTVAFGGAYFNEARPLPGWRADTQTLTWTIEQSPPEPFRMGSEKGLRFSVTPDGRQAFTGSVNLAPDDPKSVEQPFTGMMVEPPPAPAPAPQPPPEWSQSIATNTGLAAAGIGLTLLMMVASTAIGVYRDRKNRRDKEIAKKFPEVMEELIKVQVLTTKVETREQLSFELEKFSKTLTARETNLENRLSEEHAFVLGVEQAEKELKEAEKELLQNLQDPQLKESKREREQALKERRAELETHRQSILDERQRIEEERGHVQTAEKALHIRR